MIIKAIKTRKFLPPKDNLDDLLKILVPNLKEKMIIALTSKVISICEGNTLPKNSIDRNQLVQNESEFYLEKIPHQITNTIFTINHHMIIGGAGIDESNANGYYIILPKNPQKSAQKICQKLKKMTGLKSLGIIITDSHSTPLRRGATGISIGFAGFNPLKDYRHKKDLFGREFNFEVSNLPDALASAAVLVMGEGNEQTPIALISDLPSKITFSFKKNLNKNPDLKFYLNKEEDLFAPFFMPLPWKKGDKKSR